MFSSYFKLPGKIHGVEKMTALALAGLAAIAIIAWKSRSGRIKRKKSSIFTSSSLSKRAKKINATYPGLWNRGNNCFFNAILQSLASSDSFCDFVKYRIEMAGNGPQIPNQMLVGLESILRDLNVPSERSRCIDSSSLIKSLYGKNEDRICFSWDQQDAQEFLQLLLAIISDDHDFVRRSCRNRGLQSSQNYHNYYYYYHQLQRSGNGNYSLYQNVPNKNNGDNRNSEISNCPSTFSLKKFDIQRYWFGILPTKGYMLNQIECLDCGYSAGSRLSSFECLSLAIPTSTPNPSLIDCLRLYAGLEALDYYICDGCSLKSTLPKIRRKLSKYLDQTKNISGVTPVIPKKIQYLIQLEQSIEAFLYHNGPSPMSLFSKRDKGTLNSNDSSNNSSNILPSSFLVKSYSERTIKKTEFCKLPSVLCLHLNRANHVDPSGVIPFKDARHVSFPLSLDMTPFLNSSSGTNNNGKPSHLYQLKAVVEHLGFISDNGHFRVFRRVPKDPLTWLCASDEKVYKVDIKSVMNAQAYLLIYERQQ